MLTDSFSGEPLLKPHADGVLWTLENTFVIHDNVLGSMMIPKGFVTDLGSIPKIFQNIISPEGRPLRAYLGHDYLYAMQEFTRAESDACLLRMMKSLNVGLIERWIIYIAVRFGGWIAWNEDAKKLK
jgi:hypothetical protein